MRSVKIKEWIASIFPVITLSPEEKSDPEREAVIQLVSIGEMGKMGLDVVQQGDVLAQERSLVLVGFMLDAYGEVLMRKYSISRSELLPPDKVRQFAKDCIEGKYKFPGTK